MTRLGLTSVTSLMEYAMGRYQDSVARAKASAGNAATSADKAQAWAESPTPPNPDAPESKSAKSWAADAKQDVSGAVELVRHTTFAPVGVRGGCDGRGLQQGAKQSSRAGAIGAGAGLLSGLGQVSGQWYQYGKETKKTG